MHMKCLMKRMSYSWKKFLTEFNLFMQVNIMEELETSFWDFVHNLFEEIIVSYLYSTIDISSFVHYIICILIVK